MNTISKPRILAIDDDPDFLELCEIELSRQFDIYLAFDGEEGIRKLNDLEPSAVLLDLRMPRVSGLQVLEYMQLWPAMRKIPVILITAVPLGSLRKSLSPLANVYHAFSKVVSLKRISSEAKQAVLMGGLYRSTPQLIRQIQTARAATQKGLS